MEQENWLTRLIRAIGDSARQIWEDHAAPGAVMSTKLDPDQILIAEYNYIAQTVFQSNEDRARVASFYLVSFSSFIAAILTYQFNIAPGQQTWVRWGFAGLFSALTLLGLLTLLQLARLRSAWFDSIQAMNRIKDYYIDHIEGLEDAFAWRNASAPKKLKLNSVGFLLALQVALLGSTSLAAAVFFLAQAISGSTWLLPAFAAGTIFFLIQLDLYRGALK